MLDLHNAKAPRQGPKLIVSDSFMLAAQAGCVATDRLHGSLEIAWSAYGQWTLAPGDGFGTIYLTHPFLLRAACGTAWFRVQPADLSALGRYVSESHPHLTVLGQAHRHPGNLKPTPSCTDDQDRVRIANLFRDCAEHEVVERWEVPPRLPPAGSTEDVRRITQAATVTCTRCVGLSYQVFLVFNAQAERDAIHAQVMEFRRLPFGEDVATLFDDWHVEILPDAEVAARLAVDVALVQCDVDQERIEAAVEECVLPYGRSTSYAYPSTTWSSVGGARGAGSYHDPYAKSGSGGGWGKERPDG
jgi:hypothetical protein